MLDGEDKEVALQVIDYSFLYPDDFIVG